MPSREYSYANIVCNYYLVRVGSYEQDLQIGNQEQIKLFRYFVFFPYQSVACFSNGHFQWSEREAMKPTNEFVWNHMSEIITSAVGNQEEANIFPANFIFEPINILCAVTKPTQ